MGSTKWCRGDGCRLKLLAWLTREHEKPGEEERAEWIRGNGEQRKRAYQQTALHTFLSSSSRHLKSTSKALTWNTCQLITHTHTRTYAQTHTHWHKISTFTVSPTHTEYLIHFKVGQPISQAGNCSGYGIRTRIKKYLLNLNICSQIHLNPQVETRGRLLKIGWGKQKSKKRNERGGGRA